MKFLKVNILILPGILAIIFYGLTVQISAKEKPKKGKYPPAKQYNVTEAASKIKIDGILDEVTWQRAVKIELPYEWTPGDNIPAPVETECMVTFNKSKLYIAFRCFDPEPVKICAHLMDRDNIKGFLQDDFVFVTIDTFNDERRGFFFSVNPLGVQADGILNELDGSQDISWDAIWNSAGKMTDFGYVVEIAIPFNQLRFVGTNKDKDNDEKQTWGFSIERSYPRNVTHIMISHFRDRNISCLLCQANKITGFKKISQGRNLEFDPTLTLNRTDQKKDFPGGEMETGKTNIEPGLTARWGITSNLIMNAAVNPDFSHVEADAAQLEVNTRFALRYPEKRPFFLESKDFFYTPLEVVFTRTVFDPLWGVKMTGKLGKNAIGIFSNQDRYNNLLFPSNQGSISTSLEENVFSGVVRYRQDVGKGSTVGFLYTGRIGDNYYNHVAGADGFLRLSKTKDISFQLLGSTTDYPVEIAEDFDQPGDAFSGQAIYTRFKHAGRHVLYGFEFENLSPKFRADYGFIPRVDILRFSGYLEPVIWGKQGKWFDRISLNIGGEKVTDHNNILTDSRLQVSVNYKGPLQTFITPMFTTTKELYNGRLYYLNRFETYIKMRPVGALNYFLLARIGDTIDYLNSRKSDSLLLNPGFEWRIGQHLNIDVNHIYERVYLEKKKIYTANLFQALLGYHFNVRTFFRAIIQFTDINRNVALYTIPIEPRSKDLFTQFLFSYRINPQTVLFLGYSDNHSGWNGIELTRKDRTFFFKIGYALGI